MTKWARLDLSQNNIIVGEIITYDPKTIINEKLWDRFIPCGNEVTLGFYYDNETGEFYVPQGYGKYKLDDATFSPVPPGYIIGENYLFIEDPNLPKSITESEFRSKLNLAERILWDNPETGTEVQKATINTLKMDFPHYGIESMTEEFEVLEQVGFFTPERSEEVKLALS